MPDDKAVIYSLRAESMQEGVVIKKLKKFMQRYHSVRLFKGIVLLLLVSALLFFFVGGVEYLFWLNSGGRLVLLLVLATAFGFLLYRYVFDPLRWLFQLGKRWDLEEAAREIGKYFPEIEDRLLNYLQLRGQQGTSELLDAALHQKSMSFEGIAFVRAVSTKDLRKLSMLLLVPAGLFLGLVALGLWKDWSHSYTRVANYQLAYEPPAPFQFVLRNDRLEFGTHENFVLEVETVGTVVPEQVYLVFRGQERLMQKKGNKFSYPMDQIIESGNFYFESGRYRSRGFELVIRDIPRILSFEMELNYPSYLGRRKERISGSGNAIVPEGTRIDWLVQTEHTNQLLWLSNMDSILMDQDEALFTYSRRMFRSLKYEVNSSNKYYSSFEALEYSLEVIPDQAPILEVVSVKDSLTTAELRLEGTATDDYGLSELRLGSYRITEPDSIKYRELPLLGELYSTVSAVFPHDSDQLEAGGYRVFIEAKDNDGNRNGKWARSTEFEFRVSSAKDKEVEEREERESLTRGMEQSLEKLKKANQRITEYQQGRKDAENMRFSERDQLKSVLDEQIRQEELMKRFSQELQKNLEGKEEAERLGERLARQEQLAERNKRLLDELRKMAEELESDELKKELDESAKNQRAQQRSLEQLVEMTKRFLVKEKFKELEARFRKLSEQQKEAILEDNRENLSQAQDSVKKEFGRAYKELDKALLKNEELRKPLPMNEVEGTAMKEKNLLQQIEDIDKQSEEVQKLKRQQKRSQERLEELANLLKAGSDGGGGSEQQREDAESLRKIIDNLLEYTFEQEELVEQIEKGEDIEAIQSRGIKRQMELRELFGHVDDSLFALSLRQEDISEFVNEQIEEVYYNIDRALERIAENQIYQGGANQQYALSAGNRLSGFLADILDNMQEEMDPNKQGNGENEFQLEDIIQSQSELQKRLGQDKGQEGEKGNQGEEGQQGQQGEEGQQGQQGQEGQQGQQGQKGEQGQSGQNGSKGNGGRNGSSGDNGRDGKGKNNSRGKSNDSSGSEGQEGVGGMSEKQLEELLEIYKEQQRLRNKLEEQLSNRLGKAERQLLQRAVQEMRSVENELLREGVTRQTRTRMNQIQQRLLQMRGAAFQQELDNQRQSRTNRSTFGSENGVINTMSGKSLSDQEKLISRPLPISVRYKSIIRAYFSSKSE